MESLVKFDNSPNLADEDIYMNITLFNKSIDQNILAEFRDERSQPILKKASDYKMSIVRFDLPTDIERIFEWFPSRIHTVTYHDPATNTIGTATVNLVQSNYSSGGNPNNVNYFKQVLLATNQAFVDAYNDFIANYVGPYPGVAKTPTIVFRNNESGLISFYHLQAAGDSSANPLHLYLSHSLYQLYNFTFSEFYGYSQPNNMDHRIPFDDHGLSLNSISLPLGAPTDAYWINQQEANISGYWYDTYKIVIVTESMPVRLESAIVTDAISDSNTVPAVPGNPNAGSKLKIGILADFNYEFTDANIERINYSPSAEFRWIDMLSDMPLNKIDFKIYLENSLGQLLPVKLGPLDSFNMKILWRKK